MNLERIVTGNVSIGSPQLTTSGTRAGFALDSAYVHRTSGDALAIRIIAMVAASIDELYVMLDDVAGTLGNITMACDIYNEDSANYLRAGSTLRDSSTTTTMPDAADKWIKFAFASPYTPAVGEVLWLVVYNTSAAPTTDYPTILTTTTVNTLQTTQSYSAGYYTTTGWTSNGTAAGETPHVIKQGSAYIGQPFTNAGAVYSSNTLERGIQFTLTEDVQVVGAKWSIGNSAYASLRILADATAPGGTALYSYALGSDANEVTDELWGGKVFDTTITLSGGVTYKLTMNFGSNYSNPACNQIEDYSSYSAVFDAMRAQDTMSYPWSVIDNGSGGWTTDKSISPHLGLIVSDFPAQAGGSPRIGDRTGGLR